jgi:hypothetical protein
VVIIPLAAQVATTAYIQDAVNDILRANSMTEAQPAIERLDHAFWCGVVCYAPLVSAHQATTDPIRQEYLTTVYTRIANRSVYDQVRYRGD